MPQLRWPELPERGIVSLSELREAIGQTLHSIWITLDQSMIARFADVTGDDAFIHTNADKAAQTRFGGTIAHGLLTLSLMPWLLRSTIPLVQGTRMGVNYGYDSVRFLAPVPCGARIRARMTLTRIEKGKRGLTILHYDSAVELEGSDRPALVATWLLGRWFDDAR